MISEGFAVLQSETIPLRRADLFSRYCLESPAWKELLSGLLHHARTWLVGRRPILLKVSSVALLDCQEGKIAGKEI